MDHENDWKWGGKKKVIHPDGQMVSLCKTQIWCILRPQSIHSTNLKYTRIKLEVTH